LNFGLALLRREFEDLPARLGFGRLVRVGWFLGAAVVGDTHLVAALAFANLLIVLLRLGEKGWIHRPVVGREGVHRAALEGDELAGLFGNFRDRLHPGGAAAHDGDPLAGEIDAFGRPFGGVVDVTLEGIGVLEVRIIGFVQTARGEDAVGRGEGVAAVGLDRPAVGVFVVDRVRDLGFELDVPAQIEAVGNVVEVALDFRLRGHHLGPVPLLLQLPGEGVGVFDDGQVGPAARVAVPEPGAADAGAGFEGAKVQTLILQAFGHVQAGHAGADHDGIQYLLV